MDRSAQASLAKMKENPADNTNDTREPVSPDLKNAFLGQKQESLEEESE